MARAETEHGKRDHQAYCVQVSYSCYSSPTSNPVIRRAHSTPGARILPKYSEIGLAQKRTISYLNGNCKVVAAVSRRLGIVMIGWI